MTWGIRESRGNSITARQILTAARTYYVRTDGSDNNDGLSNTAGGAFLTAQKAVDVASSLDNGGFAITIQVADGTYTGTVTLKSFVGSGTITIQGNSGTPANVFINVTGAAFTAIGVVGKYVVKDMKIAATTYAINAQGSPTNISIGNLNFGACSIHVLAVQQALVSAISSYTISGGGSYHSFTSQGGIAALNNSSTGITITVSASIVFTTFALANLGSQTLYDTDTISLGAFTVTGKRYNATSNAVVYTGGGGATFLPGTVAGTTSTGGQYV